ncbi:PEBP-like protein [Phellopilus nigrolimitatus]|nr:PEBP-like protein [Phellopilus nigrolimitatus]
MVLLAFLALIAGAFFFLPLSLGQDTDLETVKTAFEKANITEAADITFNPIVLLEVSFPQASGPDVLVHAGVQLPRNQTAIPPVFGVQSSAFTRSVAASDSFVVAMVDLDPPIPQAPTEAEIRHFLGGNFALERPNAGGLSLLANSTPALSEFLQPTPPAGSDPHRYVFLLFEQSPGFNTQTEVNATTSVENFNISQFALDVGLGNPLGGSFMLVGPDPSE